MAPAPSRASAPACSSSRTSRRCRTPSPRFLLPGRVQASRGLTQAVEPQTSRVETVIWSAGRGLPGRGRRRRSRPGGLATVSARHGRARLSRRACCCLPTVRRRSGWRTLRRRRGGRRRPAPMLRRPRADSCELDGAVSPCSSHGSRRSAFPMTCSRTWSRLTLTVRGLLDAARTRRARTPRCSSAAALVDQRSATSAGAMIRSSSRRARWTSTAVAERISIGCPDDVARAPARALAGVCPG